MIETEDPTTWIVEQTENYRIYENIDGRRWKISGKCIACGMCEPEIGNVGDRIVIENIRVVDGVKETYTRTLNWIGVPGTPNACLEENYQQRKDIPITPEAVNEIEECTLSGEWITE
jgi:hypothetical protein